MDTAWAALGAAAAVVVDGPAAPQGLVSILAFVDRHGGCFSIYGVDDVWRG